jgi:tol-pal system protein YbgF
MAANIKTMRLQSVFACAALALALGLAAGGARAGLFDDDEARRQIAELRALVAADKTQVDAERKKLDERLARIETAVLDRKPLVDLALLIDGLKQDMAKLRGQIEVLANQSEQLEKRQKDLYVDLDTRLRKLESGPAPAADAKAAAQPPADTAAENKAYEAALNQFKAANYHGAIASFQGFMAAYPQSLLVPSAQYWVGNAYYTLRDYKVAISTQQKLVATWPDHAKAPDALLNIATSQSETGDVRASRETLQALIKRYPTSPAAEQARQRLARR